MSNSVKQTDEKTFISIGNKIGAFVSKSGVVPNFAFILRDNWFLHIYDVMPHEILSVKVSCRVYMRARNQQFSVNLFLLIIKHTVHHIQIIRFDEFFVFLRKGLLINVLICFLKRFEYYNIFSTIYFEIKVRDQY